MATKSKYSAASAAGEPEPPPVPDGADVAPLSVAYPVPADYQTLWVIKGDARADWALGYVSVLLTDVAGIVADGNAVDPYVVYPLPVIEDTTQVAFLKKILASLALTGIAAPTSVVADGATASTVTYTLKRNGEPMAGVPLTFLADKATAELSASSATTGADGTASVTVTDTVAETTTVTAALPGIIKTALVPVTFTAPPAPTPAPAP
jgi:hypothetical protein